MRQSPEYMESIRNSASMQSVQEYGRDTILKLLSHIETTEQSEQYWMAEYEGQADKIKRLIDNVAQLQRELSDGRKIVLPEDIASALGSLKEIYDQYDADYLAWLIARDPLAKDPDVLRTLFKYGAENDGCFLKLVNALQYGYTVEKPINYEQRLRIELAKLITTWDGRSRYTLNKDVAELLTDYFQDAK